MPDRPVTYAAQDERTSPKFARAFALGCGGSLTTRFDHLYPGPVAAFGTPIAWPLFAQAQADGRDWYYGDHGLFRRFQYYRITKNRLQHDGRGDATDERWLKLHIDRAPAWKKD